jgi:4-amino-4-deoxy-L-arabinose transferase-like glycosyltransferase
MNSIASDRWVGRSLGLITTLLHLATARDSYGIFRDELYYIANGRHLDFGYVDHPPLIGWISWLTTTLFGESQLALRLFPALAAGLTVVMVCRISAVMGGRVWAQILAGTATALAPIYFALFGVLSMNAFDVMFWAGAVLVFARLLRGDDPRLWILFGLVAGVGLENKLSVLFLGFGVVAGLVLSGSWHHFSNRWLWLGGLVAGGLFLPYLVWQMQHDWATLEFMRRAAQFKNLPLSPGEFLTNQVLNMNPVVAPLAVAALFFYFFFSAGRPFRALGWATLAILAMMVLQRAKPYYFAPALPILFAGGSVAFESLTPGRTLRWLRPVYLTGVLLSGLVLAPLAKPVLPVETFVRYQAALGMEPGTDERKEVGRLPQFFADRLGWEELAVTVAEVFHDLPENEQQQACIFAQNYGQAGAIDLYGPALGLPPAISGHNSYWLWGHHDCSGEVVLLIGGDLDDHRRTFASAEKATTYTCRDCMPYENNKPIWIGRDSRYTIEEIWPAVRHYD